MCAKVESKHQGFKFTSSDYLSITLKVNKYFNFNNIYYKSLHKKGRQNVYGSLFLMQVVCDLLIRKAEERDATSFRSSNLLVINAQTTRTIKEKQCPVETGNESDKAAEKEANINESKPLCTSTSAIPKSSQNKGGQSRNSLDKNVTDANNSMKLQNQDTDGTDGHELEGRGRIESAKAETPYSKVLKSTENTRKTGEKIPPWERKTETPHSKVMKSAEDTRKTGEERPPLEQKTETLHSKVLKSAKDTCKIDEERLLSERKTDIERNNDSSSVTQNERCESEVEDGEIIQESNDLTEGNEKKERDTAEHDPVNKLYLCNW